MIGDAPIIRLSTCDYTGWIKNTVSSKDSRLDLILNRYSVDGGVPFQFLTHYTLIMIKKFTKYNEGRKNLHYMESLKDTPKEDTI